MRFTGSLLIMLSMGAMACDGGGAQDPSSSASAAQGAQEDLGEVLATVNGQAVGSTAFQAAASRQAPQAGSSFNAEERQEILDRLVNDEVLYQEALRVGLDKDPKVKKVMVNSLLREQVYSNVRNSDFTDAELEAYYTEHQDEFVVPEKVQIKRILIRVTDDRPDESAKAEAERIRGELAKNTDGFKDLAAKHSEDPYKRRGGDVGFVSAEGKPGLDQAIVDKAFELPVNKLSEVFRTTDGYNIVLVPNRRERVERTFQQMKGSVLRKVKNDRLRQMYEDFVEQLKQGASVSVNADKLAEVEISSVRRPNMPEGMNLGPGMTPPNLAGGVPSPEGAEKAAPAATPDAPTPGGEKAPEGDGKE